MPAVQPGCLSTSCRIGFGTPRTPPSRQERRATHGQQSAPTGCWHWRSAAVQAGGSDLPNGPGRPPGQSPAPLISIVLLAALMVAGSTLLTVAGPAAAAPTSASDLQRRLEGLNRQADQQVEDYLQAKLAVERTRKSMRGMQ